MLIEHKIYLNVCEYHINIFVTSFEIYLEVRLDNEYMR